MKQKYRLNCQKNHYPINKLLFINEKKVQECNNMTVSNAKKYDLPILKVLKEKLKTALPDRCLNNPST